MEKQINIKKIMILLAIILGIIAITVITTICINKSIISKQMKTATNAITINSDSKLYKHAKESKKATNLEIGTDVYILETQTDKNNTKWYKVKSGKKVGYVKAENIKSYKEDTMKKSLMLDVSKFNLQNNFKTIGEFKAFILNNNIKYVYIRAGGRGYGKAGNLYKDPNYKEYADACEYLKIPFGFYFLDEAITSEEVTEEFNFINEFLSDNKYEYNKLPIALDVEKHLETGRADEIWDTRYTLVNELMDKIRNNGMNVILYSNANIASKYLTNVNSAMWLAYYPKVTEIPNYWFSNITAEGSNNSQLISKMVGWQFTDKGIENKIQEKVDLSIVYGDFFRTGSMNDINNDITGKSKTVANIFKLKNKNKYKSIFSLKDK